MQLSLRKFHLHLKKELGSCILFKLLLLLFLSKVSLPLQVIHLVQLLLLVLLVFFLFLPLVT